MEEEQKSTQDCGCQCEMCKSGEHSACTTGMCQYNKQKNTCGCDCEQCKAGQHHNNGMCNYKGNDSTT